MRERLCAPVSAPRALDRVEDLAVRRVRETRRALERGWLAAGPALESHGQVGLAKQAKAFVRDLPPARTEREWVLMGLLEQARRQRPREIEMAR